MEGCGENGASGLSNNDKAMSMFVLGISLIPTWVMLNFDGSKESGSEKARKGFIIRNDTRQPLAAGAIYMVTKETR